MAAFVVSKADFVARAAIVLHIGAADDSRILFSKDLGVVGNLLILILASFHIKPMRNAKRN